MIERLLAPAGRPGFWPAFGCGLVALAVGLALARRRGQPVNVGGWLLVGAVVAGAAVTGALNARLVGGVALATLAGVLRLRSAPWAAPAAWVCVVAAAVVATARIAPDQLTLRAFAVAATVGLAAAFLAFDRCSGRRGLALPLLALTAGGVYATVPDTEEALVLLAVALPLLLGGWPRPVLAFGPSGALVAAVMLGGVVATGGVGRPGSVAGGFAAAGLLAADPLARLARRGRRVLLDVVPPGGVGDAVVLAGQAALALAAGRVAGLRHDLWPALVIGGALLAGAWLLNVLPALRVPPGRRS